MDKQCPHIISSDEGTSYCSLAGKTAEYIKELEQRIVELEGALSDMRKLWLDAETRRETLDHEHLHECGLRITAEQENQQLREQLQQAQDGNAELKRRVSDDR